MNIRAIKNYNWIKLWSGRYSFLSCTYDGFMMTKAMAKYLGICFRQCIIIRKRNTSVGYLRFEELDKVGRKLVTKIVRYKKTASIWVRQMENLADEVYRMTKIFTKRQRASIADFKLFMSKFEHYASIHAGVKIVVDYLPADLLKKYLPLFSRVRLYTEPAYPAAERVKNYYLKLISRNTEYASSLISHLTKDELIAWQRGGILPSKSVLRKRSQMSALLFIHGQYKIITGKEAERLETVITQIEFANKLNGVSAYRGKTAGKVIVVFDPKRDKGFSKGDILVTAMTRPEYLPFIKKAAAIITDAGGMLSHAAIIARELRKPCIIGTKIATKVLKDGQLVEVDANKGIVKIIKRK